MMKQAFPHQEPRLCWHWLHEHTIKPIPQCAHLSEIHLYTNIYWRNYAATPIVKCSTLILLTKQWSIVKSSLEKQYLGAWVEKAQMKPYLFLRRGNAIICCDRDNLRPGCVSVLSGCGPLLLQLPIPVKFTHVGKVQDWGLKLPFFCLIKLY